MQIQQVLHKLVRHLVHILVRTLTLQKQIAQIQRNTLGLDLKVLRELKVIKELLVLMEKMVKHLIYILHMLQIVQVQPDFRLQIVRIKHILGNIQISLKQIVQIQVNIAGLKSKVKLVPRETKVTQELLEHRAQKVIKEILEKMVMVSNLHPLLIKLLLVVLQFQLVIG